MFIRVRFGWLFKRWRFIIKRSNYNIYRKYIIIEKSNGFIVLFELSAAISYLI